MRTVTTIFCLLLALNVFSNSEDGNLQITRDGNVIIIVNFQEGDKIKLFEANTGDHILSKSYGEIDLSQLPQGEYLLENNKGKSIIIEKLDAENYIERPLENTFEVTDANVEVETLETEEVLEDNSYTVSNARILDIEREGDMITVVDFKDGDEIKLFEVETTTHVLSKTRGTVDLSQLPAGKYILENNEGKTVVLEKYDDVASLD